MSDHRRRPFVRGARVALTVGLAVTFVAAATFLTAPRFGVADHGLAPHAVYLPLIARGSGGPLPDCTPTDAQATYTPRPTYTVPPTLTQPPILPTSTATPASTTTPTTPSGPTTPTPTSTTTVTPPPRPPGSRAPTEDCPAATPSGTPLPTNTPYPTFTASATMTPFTVSYQTAGSGDLPIGPFFLSRGAVRYDITITPGTAVSGTLTYSINMLTNSGSLQNTQSGQFAGGSPTFTAGFVTQVPSSDSWRFNIDMPGNEAWSIVIRQPA